VVSIENKTTMRTAKLPLGERNELSVSTSRAILTGVARVYSNILSTSVLSFERKKRCKLSPGCISNALSKAMVVNHAVDTQILNSYNAEAVDNASAILVSKVYPSVRNTLMDIRNHPSPFSSSRSALRFFGQSSLSFSQCLLITSEEAGVSNGLSSGQGSKVGQPDINAHGLTGFWKRLVFHFTSKSYKPLAGAGASNTASLNLAFNGTMDDSLHGANFRQSDTIGIDRISPLGIGKAIIPTCSTKAGIARGLTGFHSPEESLEGKVNPHSHILQYLTMNSCKRRTSLLQHRKGIDLVIHGKRLFSFFPSGLSLLQKMVVKPATLIQSVLHSNALACRRIESVAKSCLMHKYIVAYFKERRQALSGFVVCIPPLKKGVLDSGNL